MKKKKVLISSDFSKLKTGFGRNAKTVLKYLWETGKYDLVEYACGPLEYGDPALKSVPWKAYGAIPPDKFLKQELDVNDALRASVKYGSYYIDEIIENEKPDVFLGINDFWAFRDYYDKPWWNKVNSALWITIDSLPLYEEVVPNAHKIKNFWVWSKFAENELKRLGFPQVQTLHGAFDITDFNKLPNRSELRQRAGIAEDDVIIGFVFRNQVRKLVGTLIEAFALHKEANPDSKVKLLLHSSWTEGWNIERFIKEFDVNPDDVLTSHVCISCKNYTIKKYEGEDQPCHHCGNPKGLITPKTYFGVEEAAMNEIYNLMDWYFHPVTSGGLEMPIVEALMAGVPVATSNYSCGEEFCEQPFVTTIPHTLYREFGSQFMKSQPSAAHMAELMGCVEHAVSADPKGVEMISNAGIQWAREQFDHHTICKRIEDWIDNSPEADHSYNIRKIVHNPNYPFKEIEDTAEWAIDLIKGVFGYEESAKSPTVEKMVKQINEGEPRNSIYMKAVNTARAHNQNKEKTSVEEFFPDDKHTDNVAFISPQDFSKKLTLINFVKGLCESKSKVYVIGDALDEDVYQQCGKIKFIPRTDRTLNPEWLKTIKNKDGVRRFKLVSWEHNNNLVSIENESKQ